MTAVSARTLGIETAYPSRSCTLSDPETAQGAGDDIWMHFFLDFILLFA
jgi:hypothetical protein